MDSKWNVQVIINGEWEFVKELTIEQIKELQKLLRKLEKEAK